MYNNKLPQPQIAASRRLSWSGGLKKKIHEVNVILFKQGSLFYCRINKITTNTTKNANSLLDMKYCWKWQVSETCFCWLFDNFSTSGEIFVVDRNKTLSWWSSPNLVFKWLLVYFIFAKSCSQAYVLPNNDTIIFILFNRLLYFQLWQNIFLAEVSSGFGIKFCLKKFVAL